MSIAAASASALAVAGYGYASDDQVAPPTPAAEVTPAPVQIPELGPQTPQGPAQPAAAPNAAAAPSTKAPAAAWPGGSQSSSAPATAAQAPVTPPVTTPPATPVTPPAPSGDQTQTESLTPTELAQIIAQQGDGQQLESLDDQQDVEDLGSEGVSDETPDIQSHDLTVRVPFRGKRGVGESTTSRGDPAATVLASNTIPAATSLPMTGLGLGPIAALGFFMGLTGYGLAGIARPTRRTF